MIKIILLGAGNVGHHLSKAFNKSQQIDLVQWYTRDKNKIISSGLDTEIIDDLANIKSADVYIISISDSYIGDLSKELDISDKLVVLTSGSLNFTILDNKNRRGVSIHCKLSQKIRNSKCLKFLYVLNLKIIKI